MSLICMACFLSKSPTSFHNSLCTRSSIGMFCFRNEGYYEKLIPYKRTFKDALRLQSLPCKCTKDNLSFILSTLRTLPKNIKPSLIILTELEFSFYVIIFHTYLITELLKWKDEDENTFLLHHIVSNGNNELIINFIEKGLNE